MQTITIPIAFIAGVLSFFAPCVLPLLPAYVSYITGVSVNKIKKDGFEKYRTSILVSSALYILGFSLVFTLLGTAIGGVGAIFRGNTRFIHVLGGSLLIFFGLQFGGFIHIEKLTKERKIRAPEWLEQIGYLRAFLLGILFAFAWSPCIGPILGIILALAAVHGTAVNGAILLFVYSLGITFPFLVISATLVAAPKYLKGLGKYIHKVSKVSAVLLIILGILFLTGTYGYLNSWLAVIEAGYRGL